MEGNCGHLPFGALAPPAVRGRAAPARGAGTQVHPARSASLGDPVLCGSCPASATASWLPRAGLDLRAHRGLRPASDAVPAQDGGFKIREKPLSWHPRLS